MDIILRLTDDESQAALADLIARALGARQPSEPQPSAKDADEPAYIVGLLGADGRISDILGCFGTHNDAAKACTSAGQCIIPIPVNTLRCDGVPFDGLHKAGA